MPISYISEVAGRIREFFDLVAWGQWFASLDRGFAFLLLLPFVVAVVGLWSSYLRGEGKDEEPDPRRDDGDR